jgi:hypothetical protein
LKLELPLSRKDYLLQRLVKNEQGNAVETSKSLLASAQRSQCAVKGCFCLNHFENLLVDIFYLLTHSNTNRSFGSRPTHFRTKIETAIAQDIFVLPGLFRKLLYLHCL